MSPRPSLLVQILVTNTHEIATYRKMGCMSSTSVHRRSGRGWAASAGCEPVSLAGVTVGADGSVYITKVDEGRVLKLSPSGMLSIIAGSAKSGYSGDEGPATLAQLDVPRGIEIDEHGNLYVVDSKNNRVRKLMPN